MYLYFSENAAQLCAVNISITLDYRVIVYKCTSKALDKILPALINKEA